MPILCVFLSNAKIFYWSGSIFLYSSSLKVKTPCFWLILYPFSLVTTSTYKKEQFRGGNWSSNPSLQVFYKMTDLYQTTSKYISRLLIISHTFQLHDSLNFSLCIIFCSDQPAASFLNSLFTSCAYSECCFSFYWS